MKLTIKAIETKLKRKAGAADRARLKNLDQAIKDEYQWGIDRYSVEPKPDAWKSVLGLNWQVKNQVFKGCNGRAVFDPLAMIATSYGHWKFVKLIKGKVVFNDFGYSVTTSGHQGTVRRLLEELGISIYLNVDMHETLDCFESSALEPLYYQMFEAEIEQGRKGAKPRTLIIRDLKARIKKARKLGAKFSKAKQVALKADLLKREAKRLADMAVKREANRLVTKATAEMVSRNQVADLSSLGAS